MMKRHRSIRTTCHWQGVGAILLSVLVLVAVALTSCTTSPATDVPAADVFSTESGQSPANQGPAVSGGDGDDDHDHLPEVPESPEERGHAHQGPGGPMHDMDRHNAGVGEHPKWEQVDQASAVERARKAMAAFARPDLAQVVWLEGMLVHTGPQARENFAHIDPATITATQVKDVELAQVSTASMAQVIAQTDGGDYVVTMTRLAADQPWLVHRINLTQDEVS